MAKPSPRQERLRPGMLADVKLSFCLPPGGGKTATVD